MYKWFPKNIHEVIQTDITSLLNQLVEFKSNKYTKLECQDILIFYDKGGIMILHEELLWNFIDAGCADQTHSNLHSGKHKNFAIDPASEHCLTDSAFAISFWTDRPVETM